MANPTELEKLKARLAYVEACWRAGDEVWGDCAECGRPISSEEPTTYIGPPDGYEPVCQDCSMTHDYYDVIAKARHCPQEVGQ